MKFGKFLFVLFSFFTPFFIVHADTLSLTSGNNATTTPNVATSITGFQIIGNSASTTPLKLHVTNGTLSVSVVSGVTMSGNNSATINLSGTVANLNTALSSLRYTRSSTGSDTLEVALVNSDQIYFSDNGHVYQYVSSSLDWNAAKTAAEALTAYGATGYLVTITSSTENNFVKARLSGDAWIGASDSGTEGTWKWVTGPESGTTFWSGASGGSTVGGNYASWGGGEPNNAGDEDCGEEYVSDGTWNDLPCSGVTISGYVAEFGSNSNPVTVVSKNISIVTADLPSITSLYPANSSTSVSSTTNLVIGFSKNVTKQTGNILIKKVSDDSVVETIDASGDLVSGSGTNSITINPNSTLVEGVVYYIIVPSTAFKDSSNNYYEGISASTTWAFTIADTTPPNFTSINASSIATTSATISWTTNENASTKVVYSTGNSFASTTSETDTSSRVTSHSKTLSNLSACTTYNYKVVGADGSLNYATSSQTLFTTLGCSSYSTPVSATTSSVTVSSSATSSLSEEGIMIRVQTPANFTSTSSTVVIQIRSIDADSVLESLSTPNNLMKGADVVFDVKALINSSIELDSFDSPITITYTYTDEDVANLLESSLWIYHYHDDAWEALDDCSVNTSSNTITCNTPNFSIFGIFGNEVSSSVSSKITSIKERVKNLASVGNTVAAETLKEEWPTLFKKEVITDEVVKINLNNNIKKIAVRDLKLGDTGEDVKLLQKLLNENGFILVEDGLGSPGNETEKFGALTLNALIKYQESKNIKPAKGYFGTITRGSMIEYAIKQIWW